MKSAFFLGAQAACLALVTSPAFAIIVTQTANPFDAITQGVNGTNTENVISAEDFPTNGDFAAYAVMDFDAGLFQSGDGLDLESLTLEMSRNGPNGNVQPFALSGPFEIFFADATTSPLGALEPTVDDPFGPPPVPFFNPAPEFAPNGIDPAVIGDLYSLGEFDYVAADAGTVDSFELQFDSTARAILDDAIDAQGTIRLVIGATDEPVALFYDGIADGPAGDGPLQTPGGIEPLLTAVYLPTNNFPGDLNGDGRVDLLDLDILGQNFGLMGGATLAQGDINGDGNVDLLDLDILGANFGAVGVTPLPEPSTAVALLAGVALFSSRRRG